jgi:flagellar biosynthesis component FlhA
MAINPGQVYGTLEGATTTEPAFGLEAVWIEPSQRDHARALGYTVVDAATAVATHLNKVLRDTAEYVIAACHLLTQRVDRTENSVVTSHAVFLRPRSTSSQQ